MAVKLKEEDQELINALKEKIYYKRSRLIKHEDVHSYVKFDEVENTYTATQIAQHLLPHARIVIRDNIKHQYRNVLPSLCVYFNYVLN